MKSHQLIRQKIQYKVRGGEKNIFLNDFEYQVGNREESFVRLVCNFIIFYYYYLFTPSKILSAVPTQFPNFVKQFCFNTYGHKDFR